MDRWFFWFCHPCQMTVVTGKEYGKCPRCTLEMEFRFSGIFEARSEEEILCSISGDYRDLQPVAMEGRR